VALLGRPAWNPWPVRAFVRAGRWSNWANRKESGMKPEITTRYYVKYLANGLMLDSQGNYRDAFDSYDTKQEAINAIAENDVYGEFIILEVVRRY
jgi:hypothetical protein